MSKDEHERVARQQAPHKALQRGRNQRRQQCEPGVAHPERRPVEQAPAMTGQVLQAEHRYQIGHEQRDQRQRQPEQRHHQRRAEKLDHQAAHQRGTDGPQQRHEDHRAQPRMLQGIAPQQLPRAAAQRPAEPGNGQHNKQRVGQQDGSAACMPRSYQRWPAPRLASDQTGTRPRRGRNAGPRPRPSPPPVTPYNSPLSSAGRATPRDGAFTPGHKPALSRACRSRSPASARP